jgi:hypothetical protein
MSNFKIETVSCFVAVGDDGDEGVMGAKLGDTMMPLICADEARMADLFPIAKDIARETGMQFRVLQFQNRKDVTIDTLRKFDGDTYMVIKKEDSGITLNDDAFQQPEKMHTRSQVEEMFYRGVDFISEEWNLNTEHDFPNHLRDEFFDKVFNRQNDK